MKERERALRKRKEREEQEVERVRSKARRKEAVESYQALLVEIIKDPQVLSCRDPKNITRTYLRTYVMDHIPLLD